MMFWNRVIASENLPPVVALYASFNLSINTGRVMDSCGNPFCLSSPCKMEGVPGKVGNDKLEPTKRERKRGFNGTKLTIPTWELNNCMADSIEPAAMWSTGNSEFLHHCSE